MVFLSVTFPCYCPIILSEIEVKYRPWCSENNALLNLPGTNSISTYYKSPSHCPQQSSKKIAYCIYPLCIFLTMTDSNKNEREFQLDHIMADVDRIEYAYVFGVMKKKNASAVLEGNLPSVRQTEGEQESPEVTRPEKRWIA